MLFRFRVQTNRGTERVCLQLPSCQSGLVPGVTVIVPHGGVARLPLLRATLRHLARRPVLDRVVVVELDTTRSQLDTGLADFHAFAHGTPPFHKTRAMNIGLAFVRTTHFLWLELNSSLHCSDS